MEYTIYCPRSDYTTPPMTLEDVARHLGEDRRDASPCPATHAVIPTSVFDGEDAEYVHHVMTEAW